MSRDKSTEVDQEPPPKLRQQEQHQQETVVVLHDHYEVDLVKEGRRSDDNNEKNQCRLLLIQQKPTLRDDEVCRTPLSEQNKIPATTSCPPTPRKRIRRRLTNLEERKKLRFFEDSGHRDELDLFFRSSFAVADQLAKLPPPPNKRRCLSV